MDLTFAKYNSTRNVIVVHGKEYTVKKQRGRFYIHAEDRQVTVTKIVNSPEVPFNVFWFYVLEGLFQTHPCRLMDYWIEIKL